MATPTPSPEPTPTPEEAVEPVTVTFRTPQPPVFAAPEGVYTAITVGASHACALTEDGYAVCWDIASGDVWDTPPGPYTFIEAEGGETCAITGKGEIVCWSSGGVPIPRDDPDPSRGAPSGRYAAITWSGPNACALSEDGEAVCWGPVVDPWPEPPPGPFVTVSGPEWFAAQGGELAQACALSTGGEAVCWGTSNGEDRVTRWPGYLQAGVSKFAMECSLTTDGLWTCGPDDPENPIRYTAISTGGLHDCGVTEDGKGVCRAASSRWWLGGLMAMFPPDPSPQRYVDIGVGDGFGPEGDTAYGCALTEAGRALCWKNVENKVAPPDPAPGPYVAVSDGRAHTCALTDEGEAVC